MADDPHNNAAHTPGEPEDEHTHDSALFPIDEPPVDDEDTQPRAAAVPSDASPETPDERPQTEITPPAGTPVVMPQPQYPPLDEQAAKLMADPNDWASGRAPRRPAEEDGGPPRGRPLLMITVMLGTACLCMAMIGLSGFAGYRDGLATNDARVTQTLATGIAQQYATGAADLQAGYAELAEARFSWIVETIQAPTEYALDSPVQLAVARTIAAFTPTPQPTLTPSATPTPEATDTPAPEPTQAASTTPDSLQDPAHFYEQAATAYRLARYEQVIEWLDALNALDPTYQPADPNAKPVHDMLLDALTQQGRIYLLGLNEDGEDKLARGVYLIYRADDLGTVEPDWLLGQAIFVERYINARNYVNGGYYETAVPILEQLCTENCEWSYGGVSVRDLLNRAQAGAS